LFNKLGILSDFVKYEKGLDYFWAKKVMMTRKSNADVMLVHSIFFSSLHNNILSLQQNTSPLLGLSTNIIYF
jgi:hypothetical protein